MPRRRRHLDDQIKQQIKRSSAVPQSASAPRSPQAEPFLDNLAESAPLFGGNQLQVAQRQAIAGQIGQLQGNRQLQRMVLSMKPDGSPAPYALAGLGIPGFAVQRQDEGNPVAPANPGTTAHPTVRYGSTGPAVEELQQKLNQTGANLVPDGIFGPLTRAAVVSFQQANGLSPDGVVGPLTWGRIDELGLSSTVGRVERTWSEEVGGQTYGMTSRYTWRITDTEIRVTVKIKFTGANDPETVESLFNAIRGVWNGYQAVNPDTGESLDIVFDPQSVQSGEDNAVRLLPGNSRSDAANWYLDDPEIDNTAAHEFGHMIGLEDEYQRTHRDYKRLVGEEPEPGELDNVEDPEEVADAMYDALHNNPTDAAKVSAATDVVTNYGLHQGIYCEIVGMLYEVKYGVGIVEDIVNNIPDNDEWSIVDPFTYSSGSIMGMMTNHDHPVEPRHLREFVGYVQAAKGGTWEAQ
jgi:peptidoglycan hydrolase-like protein with peptidoglycan-binding domain